ncbi:MAG: hypothetical protein AABY58_00585 [Nitrospirota bacterium]
MIDGDITFIIFKHGYGSFPDGRVSSPKKLIMYNENWRFIDFEEFYSGEFGASKRFRGRIKGRIKDKIIVRFYSYFRNSPS